MPRTQRNSRKRTNHRNESTARVTSNLSPNAPEFIPIANDETAANQRPHLVIQSMTFCGSSSASNSSGSNSNSSYEVTTTNSSIPDVVNNKGQRDLLINLLNECKVDCVICYERAKNVEQIWNCRNCYQIMHLKCIIVWFIKSHCNAVWRCPACQSEMTGKPKYICFCGNLPNPYHNKGDTPHSCGQVCGLQRKNSNLNYDDCHHKCILLCHPGPCPQCVAQVLRSCGCGKKRVYAQCGQSTQIVCNNVCLKKLNCQIHECEKMCHANDCEPCNKGCPQNLNPSEATLVASNASFADAIFHYNQLPPETMVTEEELRMLGLNPEELFGQRNVHDSYYSTSNESEVDDDDYDVDIDDIDDIMQDIDFGYRSHSNFPVVLANSLSGYSRENEFEIDYPVTDDDDDDDDDDYDDNDNVNDDDDDDDDDTGGEEEDNNEDNEGSVLNSYDAHNNPNWQDVSSSSSSDEEQEIVHYSTSNSIMNNDQSDQSDQSDLWTMAGDEIIDVSAVTGSSYSEDSTGSSQSVVSLNESNSSDSTSSSSSSSSLSSSSSSSSSF